MGGDSNAMMISDRLRDLIFVVRGVQVMIDSDLAKIYDVETKVFNQAVKRNIARFPDAFRFRLTKEEYEQTFLRSQFVTLSDPEIDQRGRHRKYLPYAFTEQGVAMLSAVLRSETAIQTSIQIINAFVEMRRFISGSGNLLHRLDTLERRQMTLEVNTDARFERVFDALEQHLPATQGVFFDGQLFDAYVFINDLLRQAKTSIVLIDNYVDDSVLAQLAKRNKGVRATILTRTISKALTQDLKKHNAQYPPIEILEFAASHDRFLILDGETIYHLGASLKDLGKKWFAFSKMDKSGLKVVEKLGAVIRENLEALGYGE